MTELGRIIEKGGEIYWDDTNRCGFTAEDGTEIDFRFSDEEIADAKKFVEAIGGDIVDYLDFNVLHLAKEKSV